MIYVGTITKVHAPTSPINNTKYQYEYAVAINKGDMSNVVINNCIKSDKFGGLDDVEDTILSVGNKVLVQAPETAPNSGVIVACLRNFKNKTDVSLGKHWRRRYNKFEMGIDQSNNWYAKSDAGPRVDIKVDKIILDDSAGQRITLDKNSKTITIESGIWNVSVQQNASLTVGGDFSATITGNANISANGDINVKAKGNLTGDVDGNLNVTAKGDAKVAANTLSANIKGDAKVKASGKVEVKGSSIELNGGLGNILTDKTQPLIDLITGAPSVGVPNVKAGGA